ncbi:hypothetical protein MGAD_00180 [Mycolicibacterium gadium]|uniref:Uncharacterized protein n=1 Tax=Mycolicibacterium gadium TaxID=1794 RepID=A0A7I7WGY3_MYCGU|nr:hypothetical protein MGAD_00180 [Mycolicibacterium gadium]
MHDSGVRDEFVDAAELGGTGLDHPDHLFLVADVGPETDRAAADFHRRRVAGAVDIRAQYVSALVGEARCDRETDAGARAGDNGGLARKVRMRHVTPRECV